MAKAAGLVRVVVRRRPLEVAVVTALVAGLLGPIAAPPAPAAVGNRPVATWNMQGANNTQTDKWETGVGYLARGADVVTIQEAGPRPPARAAGTQAEVIDVNNGLLIGGNADGARSVLPPGVGREVTHLQVDLDHGQLRRHVYWLATDRVANTNGWTESENRVNLAIVTAVQADQVAIIVNPLADDTGINPFRQRAALGVRMGDTWYFDIHALAGNGNDGAGLLRNIVDFIEDQPLANQAPHWIALGDYNRDPEDLEIPEGTRMYDTGEYTHNVFGQGYPPAELDYAVGTAPAGGTLPMGRILDDVGQMADHVPVVMGQFRAMAEPTPIYQDATVESMEAGGVLDVHEQATADGSWVYSNLRNAGTNQRWTILEDGSGSWIFRGIGSDRCLDSEDGSLGVMLRIRDCDDNDTSQRWMPEYLGNSEYQLHSMVNRSLCLNVSGGQSDIHEAKPTILWDCNNTPNERWIFTSSSPNNSLDSEPWDLPTAIPGPITLESLGNGGVMDVNREDTANGSQVIQYHRTRGSNQGWYLLWADDETVTFRGVQSGRCLDIRNRDNVTSGSELELWDCDYGLASQQWHVDQLRGRQVMLRSAAVPYLCLDVTGDPDDPDGTFLEVFGCSTHDAASRNQTWEFTPFDPNGDPARDSEGDRSDDDDPSWGSDKEVQDEANQPAERVAYYPSWAVYQNAFYPKNLDTQGIAGKLTTLNYAFENIDPVNLTCMAANKASSSDESDTTGNDGSSDAWADYQMSYPAENSIDGVADSWGQPLKGNFNQLKKLKAKYPDLKIVLSLGGWTYSKYFSDVAATDSSRKKFVSSCIDMYIKGNLPKIGNDPAGGTGVADGIFDGFDIDWEFPGSQNGHAGNHVLDQDGANYTALLKEFRTELDALGGKHYQLTAALPAGPTEIGRLQVAQLAASLDLGDIMTYDFHGAFETQGPTNFQSPLYDSSESPANGTRFTANDAVNAYLTQGFPAGKLTLGVPLYGRGWTGVPDGGKNGLYQSVTGPTAAFGYSQSPGVVFYKELAAAGKLTSDNVHSDPQTHGSWVYDGTNFWSIESPLSLAYKRRYIKQKGLAGVMMYSLEADDSSSTLLNAATGSTDGTE